MGKKTLCFTGFLVFGAVLLLGSALADMDADNEACTNQLDILSTGISYVQGTDKSLKADCCTNLKTVRRTYPKCLCVLVKDRSSPSLGVSINQTLTLGLPSTCKVNVEISKCPALLNLSPNSPYAKIFEAAKSSSFAPPSSCGSSPSTATKDSAKSLKPQLSLSALAVLLPLGFFRFCQSFEIDKLKTGKCFHWREIMVLHKLLHLGLDANVGPQYSRKVYISFHD